MVFALLPPRVDIPPRPPPPPRSTLPVDAELSSGEVNFLFWFMQGSIMDVEVRWALRKSWGLCPRHTAAWLMVEAAFRDDYLHGPAVLFDDLMERACAAFDVRGPGTGLRLARRLRPRAACHLCAMGVNEKSQGFIPGDRLVTGRDPTAWRRFAEESRDFWSTEVCGPCSGSASAKRCRAHLCADLTHGRGPDIDACRQDVLRIARHMSVYHNSFSWDFKDIDGVEDRAALISAAGWCSGWQGLLALLDTHTRSKPAENFRSTLTTPRRSP